MRCPSSFRFSLLALLSCPCLALTQPSLDRLEQQLQAPPADDAAANDRQTGYLGIEAEDTSTGGRGVMLTNVVAGGPAAAAGLAAGDLVTAIDGRPVATWQDVEGLLRDKPSGTQVVFHVVRNGQEADITARLGQRPPPSERLHARFGRIAGDQTPGRHSARPSALLGVRTVVVTPAWQALLGLPEPRGLLVTDVVPGSPAHQAGIPIESVIVAVDGLRVDASAELARHVQQAGPGSEITLSLFSQGNLVERKATLAAVEAEEVPPPPAAAPPLADPLQRLELFQRRLELLERRLAELERRLAELPPPAANVGLPPR